MHELPAEPGPDCVTAGEQSAHYEAVLERVTLALLSRIMNRASGMLRINDIDERLELENAATLTLAKKLGLVS